jgi:chitin-binding protein
MSLNFNRDHRWIWGLLGLLPLSISAHGIIETPLSRTAICGEYTKPDEIANGAAKTPACSTAFKINPMAAYNYMAVVTHALGRSEITPLPKHVCGFEGESWKGAETPWDVPMDWPTTPMTPGLQPITWNIVWGPHFDDTHDFKYWITKSSFVFSPTKALSWDDFETEPFCVEIYDDTKPTSNPNISADKVKSLFTTKCQIPERKGHHVIYGEWGRTGPTFERFHGCVDLAFGASNLLGRQPWRKPATSLTVPDLLGRTLPTSTEKRLFQWDSRLQLFRNESHEK